jgi:hypothetical protein
MGKRLTKEEALAKARAELGRQGGIARGLKLTALKEAAAAGDKAAKKELERVARVARENGKKGGRPKKEKG